MNPRPSAPDSTSPVRFGRFLLDASRHELKCDGSPVDLSPKVFEALVYLVRNADRVVPKNELLDTVWRGTLVTDNVLAQAISSLRKVLDDNARSPRFIKSVPRVGYRFVGDIRAEPQGALDPSSQRLAVLPFETFDGHAGDAALESGIADGIIARLSSLSGLIVRPLASTRMAQAGHADQGGLGQFLEVDWILEGRIGQRDGRILVNFRLTSVEKTREPLAQTYDRSLTEIFTVQDDICERVIEHVLPQAAEAPAVSGTTTVPAYTAYLEGRLFLDRFTQHDVERAATLFERSLDHDPSYAPAWASLAECHEFFGTIGASSTHHYETARSATRRALKLDKTLPEAHCMLAKIAWQFDWDWHRAAQLFAATLEAFPNRPDVVIAYSDYCCFMKAGDQSIELARRALSIDPVSPWVNTLLAQALHMAGRDVEAIAQAERTLELAPGFPFARFFLGLSCLEMGDPERGVIELGRAVESGRPDFLGAFATALVLAGDTEQAAHILEGMVAAGDEVPPIAPAIVRLALGEYAEAEAGFRECIERRDWHVLALHSEPVLVRLAAGTRLSAMLEQLNLPGAP